MKQRRIERINSLLIEVVSEVINKDVKHPDVHELTSVAKADVSADLHYAKIYISVIGTDEDKKKTLAALESAAGFIAVNSSKKVVLHHFPQLTFKLDTSADEHMNIEKILEEIEEEKSSRSQNDED